MTPEIICTIVTVLGTVISALIAYFVSRSTTNKEIEKMKLTWEREDIISSDDEFADMAAATAKFVHINSSQNRSNALSKIAVLRSKEVGSISSLLDCLYYAVRSDNQSQADAALTSVIEEKRRAKSKSNAPNRDKP